MFNIQRQADPHFKRYLIFIRKSIVSAQTNLLVYEEKYKKGIILITYMLINKKP